MMMMVAMALPGNDVDPTIPVNDTPCCGDSGALRTGSRCRRTRCSGLELLHSGQVVAQAYAGSD